MRYGFMKFLEPDGGQGGGDGGQQQNQDQPQSQANQPPAFDYEKLASLVAGKQSVTEDTVLKSYFKQQGLSQEEAEQAISSFKEKKAQNTPDVAALQNQVAQERAQAQRAQVESAAIMAAMALGLDAKTIPYALKMADLSQAVGQDGKINNETLTAALKKVLEDVPALKPQETSRNTGFTQIGTGGNPAQQPQPSTATQQTPTKRWNRWN